MGRKSLFVFLIITMALFEFQAVPVHADTVIPYLVQKASHASLASTTTTPFVNATKSGNLVIASGFCELASAVDFAVGPSDTLGLSWTPVNQTGTNAMPNGILVVSGGDYYLTNEWYAFTSGGSDSIQITCPAGGGPIYAGLVIMEVNGAGTPVKSAYNQAASTTIQTTGGADYNNVGVNFQANSFLAGAVMDSNVFNPPGLTMSPGFSNAVAGATWGFITVMYGTQINSPSIFPATYGTSGGWSEMAAAFAPATLVVKVIPCSAFNLQCWLYPLFVFGIYMILIIGMAVSVRVPGRDMTGHLLEAFSLAAMLCVLFGILNIMVPLLITVLQVIRAIRS